MHTEGALTLSTKYKLKERPDEAVLLAALCLVLVIGMAK